MVISYGKGQKNPLDTTTFYETRKDNSSLVLGVVSSGAISRLLPREFEDTCVRIYCRYKAQRPLVRKAFEEVLRNTALQHF